MELTKKEKRILEKYFSIFENEDLYELEQWTDGGINMFVILHKEDDRFNSITEQFRYYVEGFNIDEEIDIHRQDKRYRDDFRITESVRDFEDWEKYIKKALNELEEEKRKNDRKN